MTKASDVPPRCFLTIGIGEPVGLLLTVGGAAFTDHFDMLNESAEMAALKTDLLSRQMLALQSDSVFLGQTDSGPY